MPTRKWFANLVVAVTGILIAWATTGTWDQEETVALITIASAALVTYLVPYDPANPASGRPSP